MHVIVYISVYFLQFLQTILEYPPSLTVMAADSQKKDVSLEERQQAISTLCQDGGVVVVCETVVALHENDHGEQKWKVVEYGIPAVIGSRKRLVICIADVESGETVREIRIDSSSQYQAHKDHFHVFVPSKESNQQCYGFSFVDVGVAKKVFSVIKQLAQFSGPNAKDESTPPSAKRQKMDKDLAQGESDNGLGDDWVVIEPEDMPSESQVKSSGQAAEPENQQQVIADEGVDAPFGFGRKRKKEKEPHVLEISSPTDFKHVIHIGSESSIGTLTSAILVASQGSQEPGSPEKKVESESKSKPETTESGTIRSSSFEELEPAEVSSTTQLPRVLVLPSPTRKRLPSETKIPPVPRIGFNLPEAPPLSDHEALLLEISTFDRTKLRRITPEEIAQTKNMPDSQESSITLNSLLKSGLDKMRSKLQHAWQFSRMGSISGSGDEEGFDEFDFPLFTTIED